MPRLSFKPDASFFRKIVLGAVGARSVCADLEKRGHHLVELERGSTDTKLWKDVKRKRVRIPDLVCTRCGLRIECRAKSKAELSMSHSPTDAERAWDFGMVDNDWIAFPVCAPSRESNWSAGALSESVSYWRQKEWVHWRTVGHINYFTVEAFRSRLHVRSRTKGVEEASENFIGWDAVFSTRAGTVEAVDEVARRVSIRRSSDNHLYAWKIPEDMEVVVSAGQGVKHNQVIASSVPPVLDAKLPCAGKLPRGHLRGLLGSRERTQRFTGVKLARLRNEPAYEKQIVALAADNEEDVYVRLEAAAYLTAVSGHSTRDLFPPYLQSPDPQTQLEAVIALGEAGSPEAVDVLSDILDDPSQVYFLRSAAAWSLSRMGSEAANRRLVQAFSDIDLSLREEALTGLVTIGGPALPALLEGLRNGGAEVTAGCAEALRQYRALPEEVVRQLVEELYSEQPQPWAVWLVGHLPREQFAGAIAELQHRRPDLHYAISLLWSFIESWISRHWEAIPLPEFPRTEEPE